MVNVLRNHFNGFAHYSEENRKFGSDLSTLISGRRIQCWKEKLIDVYSSKDTIAVTRGENG